MMASANFDAVPSLDRCGLDYQIEEMQREIAAAQQQMDEGLRRGLGEDALNALEEHLQDLGLRLQELVDGGHVL